MNNLKGMCIVPFALQKNFVRVLQLKDSGWNGGGGGACIDRAALIHIAPCIATFNDRLGLHQKS